MNSEQRNFLRDQQNMPGYGEGRVQHVVFWLLVAALLVGALILCTVAVVMIV